ncbi:MAG TPA: alpha-galactosidase [bacterium]|uniref:Melibiase n=1 Tax=candidate division TA06 bacterium ADurb.Bin417 TaxID=1852828 RepID=A0A1V5MIE1_UNCT6|nr:MAG: Melibiase [candidate division TA06 bacterium ADurb.Bin417]HNQ35099.1 alpha-galactosidase [bacterium]HNS48813.1 alpha-galactosidase [bacterium]
MDQEIVYRVRPLPEGFLVEAGPESLRLECLTWFQGWPFPPVRSKPASHPRGGFLRPAAGFQELDADFNTEGIRNLAGRQRFGNELEEVQVIHFNGIPGLAWRRVIRGAPDRRVHIGGLVERVRPAEGSRLAPGPETFCFHAENARLYNRYCLGVLEDRTRPPAGASTAYDSQAGTFWAQQRHYRAEVGRSPFQPFPAMIYGHPESDLVLLEASLTQARLYRYYECGRTEAGDAYLWTQAPKTVNALVLEAGESLAGEWNYLALEDKNGLKHPFDDYLRALENFPARFRGRDGRHGRQVIWGSYNCGIWIDFDQERILKTADYIKENLPRCEWIQIDAGYDAWDEVRLGSVNNVGIGMAYPGEAADPKKFPEGMPAFTAAIKKRGLRPALWVGFYAGTGRRLYQEHPDWFLPYGIELGVAILDLSRPEVRDFVKSAFRLFIKEWGFEGIKLDFWSYLFEEEALILPAGRMSGTEYRNWLLQTIRELLPEDGYLQLGCDIAMANPHLAAWADNYRYGRDIGSGQWETVRTNARWAAFCLNTRSGHLFVPNSDAVGVLPGLSDTELRTHLNFCLVSRTLVEIGGWLHQDREHFLMPFLQKAACCPGNGDPVHFAGFDFTAGDEIPAVWYLKGPHFSRLAGNRCLPQRTFGVFNWEESPRNFEISAGSLGLPEDREYLVKDFWSGRVTALEKFRLELAGHASALFGVLEADEAGGILDSNAEITAAAAGADRLTVSLAAAGRVELTLRRRPARVLENGRPIEARITELEKGAASILFKERGAITVDFEF